MSEASAWLMGRFSKLGFNDFSWLELTSFENKTGITFDNFESELMKKCSDLVEQGLSNYREAGAEPPYMSEEFRKRREQALEQAQKFNDDRGESKK